jgi:tetratricopeptide (TPR) repeat protein
MFFEEKIKKRILYITPLLLTMLIIPISLLETEKLKGDLMGNIGEVTRVDTNISRMDYLLTQFTVVATYIRLIFFPINQNLDYEFPIYNTFLTLEVFLSFLLLFFIFGLGIYMFLHSRTRDSTYRIIAFGIFWLFITLSVESSFIPIVDVIFEHRVYLPSTGFFIALTTGIFLLLNKFGQRNLHTIGVAIIVTVIIMFSVLTYSRNNIWSSEIGIWQDTVEKSPQKARPHWILGTVLNKQGRTEEAIEHYLHALRINPELEFTHYNLGLAFYNQGRTKESIEHYLHALQIKPDYEKAHYNLGNVLNEQDRTEEAIEHYLQALRIKPDYEEAHNNLAISLVHIGNIERAIAHFRKSLHINPDFVTAKNNLKKVLMLMEKQKK